MTNDSDGDGVCDSDEVVGCQDSTACNYNANATDAGSCTFADVSACQSCSGGSVVTNDSDGDGVCDDVDDCVGNIDSCGVCAGTGPSYDCGDNGDLVCSDTDCPTTGGVTVDIDLGAGWNWISTNVLSENMTPNSIIPNAEDGDFLKNQSTFSQYYAGYGWYGGVGSIDIGRAYKLNIQNNYNWTYTGSSVSPSDYLISLNPGWNWMGYVPNVSLSTNNALDFNAEEGDFIKSQATFSQYYAGYGWYGGVTSLSPFAGYLINVASSHDFFYPNSLSRIIEDEFNSNHSFDFNYNRFEFNGSITASLNCDNLEISSDDMLVAYDENGDVRGYVNPVYFPLTNEYIFMLMVYSNDVQDNLSFEFYDNDLKENYSLNQTVKFESDMIIGDGFNPLEFSMNSEEEISSLSVSKAYPNPFNPTTNLEYSIVNSGHVKVTVFDVTGRQVSIIENSYKTAGDYNVIWNAQNNTSGIYYIQILSGNEIKTQKVVLLK